MELKGLIFAGILLLVAYRLFSRARRLFAWQTLNTRRLATVSAIMAAAGAYFFSQGASHTASLVSNTLGIAAGLALAVYGASRTRYERRDGEWTYKPNEWIGGAVTVLFAGRIVYRLYQMAESGFFRDGAPSSSAALPFVSGSWSSGLLLLMLSYYFFYYLLLLRRTTALKATS